MDEFLDRLAELDDFVSEIRLQQVVLEGELRLHIAIKGTSWEGDEVAETWIVRALGAGEHRVRLGELGTCERSDDSPRLLVARAELSNLYFASAPADARSFFLELRERHDETRWGPFGRYGLGQDLSFGVGLFASGPVELMTLYAEVLSRHAMRPSFVPLLSPRERPEQCLYLGGKVWEDDRYILAHAFRAERILDA